jgi:hypothetical protein
MSHQDAGHGSVVMPRYNTAGKNPYFTRGRILEYTKLKSKTMSVCVGQYVSLYNVEIGRLLGTGITMIFCTFKFVRSEYVDAIVYP